MTTPAFVTAANVRDYLGVNGATGNYSDGAIGSNIKAASEFLERATGRWFADRPAVTYTTTSQDATAVTLPGFRLVSGVTQQGTTLALDSTYYLVPDSQQSGIFTGLQLRGFGSRSSAYGYLSNPEWFDRDLDRLWGSGWSYSTPNDIVVTGDGGYADADIPYALRHATKVLAGWYTKRPDSVLASVAITPEGNVLNYADLPPEVGDFIANWRLSGPLVVSVG